MRRFHARGRGRSAQIEKWFSHMKIVVAERQDDIEADDDVIEASALPVPAQTFAPDLVPVVEADHAHTDTALSVPETEGTAAEAAEQAMSADAANVADRAAPAEPHAAMSAEATTDHAHTDAELSVPATEGTEAEAAQQSMSVDAAEVADRAAAAEPHAAMPETASDHAHTEAELSVPATEGTEAEAAEQAMSADAAETADQAAADQTPDQEADQPQGAAHHTPPEAGGQGAA
jgi:hypothetical protein